MRQIFDGDTSLRTLKQEHFVSSAELLNLTFYIQHPLRSQVKLEITDYADFGLYDHNSRALAPLRPSLLHTQFKVSLEPPMPGQYSIPPIKFKVTDEHGRITEIEDIPQFITVTNVLLEYDQEVNGLYKKDNSLFYYLIAAICLSMLPLAFSKSENSKQQELFTSKDLAQFSNDCPSLERALAKYLETNHQLKFSQLISSQHAFSYALYRDLQKARYSNEPADLIELSDRLKVLVEANHV